jgi:RHS repeat-associated protein
LCLVADHSSDDSAHAFWTPLLTAFNDWHLFKTWRQAGSPGVDWVRETYTWDKENRLKGWEKKRLLVTGVQTEAVLASATWTYDGLGRRVKEQNVAGATVTNTHFIWDGMTMVQWQSATGVAQRNLFDEGEHNVITGEKLIYVKDHLGSVRGWHRLSDGARGEADYSAWGVRTVVSNTTGTMPVSSFTGHYQHAASGLVLAPYRAYDAELGRWLSEDPIGEEGGVNLYGYGPNNPLGGVDPFGADWHHLIPFAAGIDAGLPASFINGAGNGWDMCNADHKALHAAHWTAEWNQFFKNAPKPVSIPAAQAHLDKLRLDSRFASILSKGKSVSGPFKKGASRLAARTASLAAKSRVLPGAFKLAGFFAGFCEMSSDASDNGVSAALRTQRYRLGSMTGQTPEEYDEMANRTSEGFFSRLFQ